MGLATAYHLLKLGHRVSLFEADKPLLFRLTHNEKLAAQERAVVALRVAILRKHTGLSLRQFAQFLSHSPLYQWFCQINRFATIKIPGKSTIDDYEKMMPPSLSSDLDRRLLQLASQSGELLEQPDRANAILVSRTTLCRCALFCAALSFASSSSANGWLF